MDKEEYAQLLFKRKNNERIVARDGTYVIERKKKGKGDDDV